MDILKIGMVQTHLFWEDKQANLDMLTEKLKNISAEQVDMLFLPEMFSTGFSMRPTLFAETMQGESVQWMSKLAQKEGFVLAGSLIITENNAYYNRLIWAFPNGNIQYYDKKHLFSMAGEHNHYTAGDKNTLIEYKGWRLKGLVCYDLRFPVWARNTAEENYDILVYVANWPARRSAHWKTLLPARAVENQAFVIGVNRIGEDGNGIYHSGDSILVAANGDILYQKADQAEIFITELSKKQLYEIREKLPFLKDQDRFELLD
jgi:omega-amidase